MLEPDFLTPDDIAEWRKHPVTILFYGKLREMVKEIQESYKSQVQVDAIRSLQGREAQMERVMELLEKELSV
jgi:hypothetical protein